MVKLLQKRGIEPVLKEAVQYEYSTTTDDPNIQEIRIVDKKVQVKKLPLIWDQVCQAISGEQGLRVLRKDCNGVIREDCILLVDRRVNRSARFQGREIPQTNKLTGLALATIDCTSIVSVTPMYERRENVLMPRAVRITVGEVGVCKSCPPEIATVYVDVYGQEHYSVQGCNECGETQRKTLDSEDESIFEFLSYFWGPTRWMEALNAHFTQLADGKIVEIMVDEYGNLSRTNRTKNSMIEYFAGNKYVKWIEATGKSPGRWELHDVISKLWLTSLERSRCKDIVFNPQRPPGKSGDFFNVYEGLAFEPLAPEPGKEAAPLLRQHIREVICSDHAQQTEFLLDCLAKMVQYPWLKLKICIVLVSKQGAGKNTLLDVIRDIFGRHGGEITHQRHVTGNFNNHLRYKLFLVLNEATWGGDKAASGAFKAAITEYSSLFEPKGVDAKDGINHWSFFVASNEKWCIPATLASRRFVVFEVSGHRIGNHQYFNAIHQAMDREKREFLWFLLNRRISRDWEAAEHMPPRSMAMADQILQDRDNIRLKWLVDQLQEEGEWFTHGRVPIIQKGKATWIKGKSVREAWLQAAEHNRHLEQKMGESQHSLTNFFKRTLGPCFKSRVGAAEAVNKDPSQQTAKWFYEFAPAEDIKKYLAEECLGVPDYFAEEPAIKRHKKDTAEEE